MGQRADKETLKALRQARQTAIARARDAIQANNKIFKAIREQLGAAPQTVPEIAQALKVDPAQVLLFVAALKKYGEVVEGAKEGQYFKYGMTP